MNRYFIKLAFDGTNYHGWQIQPNARTVQSVLGEALSLILREKISLTGCGRTDTGVHAREFFAHFDLDHLLSTEERQKVVHNMNSFLGDDIVIYSIIPVKPQTHARFSAFARTYQYVIARYKDPFLMRYAWFLYAPLDLEAMNRGADFLLSVSDFTSFSKVNTDAKTTICRVSLARWNREGEKLTFTIRADRFLRNMVRAIVGTLIELGVGKITFDEYRQIIASKNRCDAGESVPACGLFLTKVDYPELF